MRKLETTGQIKSGVLKIAHRDKFHETIRTWKDCYIILTIRKQYKQRTTPQNAYYWAVIVDYWKDIMYQEWGELLSKEDVHAFLKANFNSTEIYNETTGEILTVPVSTTKNTTVEQEVFHELCRQKAFEMFNVMIPLPGEQLEMKEL
jgi:hypothetical protein